MGVGRLSRHCRRRRWTGFREHDGSGLSGGWFTGPDDNAAEGLLVDPQSFKRLPPGRILFAGDGEQDVLRADIVVTESRGLVAAARRTRSTAGVKGTPGGSTDVPHSGHRSGLARRS